MTSQTMDAAPGPKHLNPDDAAKHLTGRLQAAGIDKTISSRLLEAWRSLRKGPAFTRAVGRVWYPAGELDAFAQKLLDYKEPSVSAEKLLPLTFLGRELSTAEASCAWWLLHGGRGMSASFDPDAPHVAPFRTAFRRATAALQALVEKAADDGVAALALDLAIEECGSLDKVEPTALVRALDQLTVDFKGQLTLWASSQVDVAAACDQQRQLRTPLRQAVGLRLDQLVNERHVAISKRDAMGRKGAPQSADLVAAGVPPELLDAVRSAIGEPVDIATAIEALNNRIGDLALRIERLKNFRRSPLGDYSLLDGEGFDDLIGAERAALGLAA